MPVSPATARQAHRILKDALDTALSLGLVARNVAASIRPQTGDSKDVTIPGPDDITSTLETLRESKSELYPIVALALASGARRGELCALRWGDLDLDAGTITIERTLEQTTKYGYCFKPPKTRAARRTISVPLSTLDMLREHRRQALELRMRFGLGRMDDNDLIFCKLDGSPLNAEHVTVRWRRAVKGKWSFHALRHAHASLLIADGLDVVSVAHRLGHSSPATTLRIYAHLFRRLDDRASGIVEKVLGAKRVPKPSNNH
jgi:integrase